MSTRTRKTASSLLVGFFVMLAVLCLLPPGVSAGDATSDYDIVLFEREGKGAEHLKELGLTPQLFTQETIGAPFVSALQRAQMLYIGQACSNRAEEAIFRNPAYCEAITELLKRGGTLFFDYNGLSSGESATAAYLSGVGVEIPTLCDKGQYRAGVSTEDRCALTDKPNKITGTVEACHWWEDWSEAQLAPFRSAVDSSRAAMIVQEGVLGKGKVVINQLFRPFRGGRSQDLLHNIIEYAYGAGAIERMMSEKGGPGELIARTAWSQEQLSSAIAQQSGSPQPRAPNSFYLRELPEKPWWDMAWEYRLPVLVTECAGKDRASVPVSVIYEFPADVRHESIRVVWPWGEETPCQTRVLGEEGRKIEVVFLLDMLPYTQTPLFIYYGNPDAPAPRYASDLSVEEKEHPDGDYLTLSNDKVQVELSKTRPNIEGLRPRGGSQNEIIDWGDFNRAQRHGNEIDGDFAEARLVEDGPIRKTVQYAGRDSGIESVTYTLYADSNLLRYKVKMAGGSGFSTDTRWNVGNDGERDSLYYETPQGIKRIKIKGDRAVQSFDNLRPHFSEGWYAIADERGEAVGHLFELGKLNRLQFLRAVYGEFVWLYFRARGEEVRGAVCCFMGDYQRMREAYVEWRSAPEVYVGAPQERTPISPKVPVFGEDFIREHWLSGYFRCPRVGPQTARQWVEEALRLGANWIGIYAHRPFWETRLEGTGSTPTDTPYLKELLNEAHSRGMGVSVCSGVFEGWYMRYKKDGRRHKRIPSPATDEMQMYRTEMEDLARHGVDLITVADEFSLHGHAENDPACKALFEQRYGMKAPDVVDYSQMDKPVNHNWVLFKMELLNEVVRNMSEAARAVNPDVILRGCSGGANLTHLSRYQDLETFSSYLDLNAGGCGGRAYDRYKHIGKLWRGSWGNDRQMCYWCGYSRYNVEMTADISLLTGATALNFFDLLSFLRHDPRGMARCTKVYNFLDYTGLGDMFARAKPLRFAAILRDRAAFIDSIKRGETRGGLLPKYSSQVELLSLIRNMPTDILYSKYLTPGELSRYRCLLVPSDRVLSDEFAQMIVEYVENGGCAIIEGETIDNPHILKLCAVRRKGEPVSRICSVKGIADPIKGMTLEMANEALPVEATAGDVLATFADGSPAIVHAPVGKGKVLYIAMTRSSDLFTRKLVRHLVGYLPVNVPDEAGSRYEARIFKSGKAYIVGVYNRSKTEPMEFHIPLKIGAESDWDVIDFKRGSKERYTGTINAELAAEEIKFYVLAPEGSIVFPEIGECERSADYSETPSLLPLRITSEAETTKKPIQTTRTKETGQIYVGIFKNREVKNECQMGTQAIHEAASKLPAVQAEFLDDLSEDTIGFYDVIIVPNMGYSPVENLNEGWEANIRKYVERGGSVLLIHHSVGFGTYSNADLLFPEIGSGAGCTPLQWMEAVAEHPAVTGESFRERFKHRVEDPTFRHLFGKTELHKSDRFKTGFPDYIQIAPGAKGKTLARSVLTKGEGGHATLVVGEVGSGKVVLSGLDIGCFCEKRGEEWVGQEKCTEGEEKILTNALYWLASE